MQQGLLKRTVSWDTTDIFKVALLVKKIIITSTNSAYLSSCLDVHGVIGVCRRLRFNFHSDNFERLVLLPKTSQFGDFIQSFELVARWS